MAKRSFFDFVKAQWSTLPPVHHIDLSSRTVVITGADGGLGLQTAVHIARMTPETLVLAVQVTSGGETAAQYIRNSTMYTGNIRVMELEQTNMDSAVKFVADFEASNNRLDHLIVNAGVALQDFTLTRHGHETCLQVNHISPALLVLLLVPRMFATAQAHATYPRITIVSSLSHTQSQLVEKLGSSPNILQQLSDALYSTREVMNLRYADTKLMNIFFTRSLSQHLGPTSRVDVDCVNPGLCWTQINRHQRFPDTLIYYIMKHLFGRTAEDGAKTIVWAALAGSSGDDTVLRERLRGAYTSECQITEPADQVFSEDGVQCQKKIWNETIGMLSAAYPRVKEITRSFTL